MNNRTETVSINQAVPRLPEIRFREPVQWQIRKGEQWAVIGPNGCGKTILADLLQQRYALKEGTVASGMKGKIHETVRSIAFKDIHSLSANRNVYYQQRWHATETDEFPTVAKLLGNTSGRMYGKIKDVFNIEADLSKRIIHLSSGELRKFLIIRALAAEPELLILDNPLIGLDAESRGILTDTLERMIHISNLQVVLLLSNPDDIPRMITHVLPVLDRRCHPSMTAAGFAANKALQAELFRLPRKQPVQLPQAAGASLHQITVGMKHVSVTYGSRMILKDVDWIVRNGEKWSLYGPNGSGKSLLLSLIYADNPQAYAQSITLFDRKRGTGESIWDIKKRIGYVSPEIHLYCMENLPALDLVCSGFFDTIGLCRKCSGEQKETACQWMQLLGIGHLKARSFLTLSSGEQRLTLLARAFVKDPDLLILDEPLHGLDISNKQLVTQIIDRFCKRKHKTLIYVTHYMHELPACITKHFKIARQQ
jgi:molybdate transport system ATP-binding protein